MDKIRAPVSTPQPSTSSVKLLDFIGRHYGNYFLKLISNQHLTKILCEPLCPKTPMQNYTDYCQNECDLWQDMSLFIPFIPHCPAHWRGNPVNPIQHQRWRCSERGGGFDVSAAQILPVLPALRPWGFQIKAVALLQKADWFAKKKEESLPKRKLTELLGCVLEASPLVLAGSSSVAHADLLATRVPIPLPGFPGARGAWS